jgi:hypothetical protein
LLAPTGPPSTTFRWLSAPRVSAVRNSMSNTPTFLKPNWYYKLLPYGGICHSCGRQVAPREVGWHDPVISKILCAECGQDLSKQRDAGPLNASNAPVGGASTLRWASSGNSRNRRKGAAGEYLIDQRLHRDLVHSEVILNDRQVPGGSGNIDHVVVAPSGVWVIDTKHWKGRVEYKGASGFFDPNERLFFNGEDCTHLADDIYAQVIPIAELLNDRSIPIRPALVFIDAGWKSTLRLATNKPYRHNHVLIAWPKALTSEIQRSGPLDLTQVSSIGGYLDELLRPM